MAGVIHPILNPDPPQTLPGDHEAPSETNEEESRALA